MRERLSRVTSWMGWTVWPFVAGVLGQVLAIDVIRLLVAAIVYFGLVIPAFFLLNIAARLLGVNFDNPGPAGSFLITVGGLIGFIAPTGAGYANVPMDRALAARRGPPIGCGDR
jgi:hypothetical protein